jgi:hypothetical protein
MDMKLEVVVVPGLRRGPGQGLLPGAGLAAGRRLRHRSGLPGDTDDPARLGLRDVIQPFPTCSEIYVTALKSLHSQITAASPPTGRHRDRPRHRPPGGIMTTAPAVPAAQRQVAGDRNTTARSG